ncbi:Neurogenic locus Notch protein [Stylophora pistillata]|uniref:Neurogenic locus Notch protein n=1 Tax=Stylophora pistillata TaxID=50429 RepID=A0A2B4S4X8_STYPI|nr:Neurogenic locus Notch protein [Stylophora pistillata]
MSCFLDGKDQVHLQGLRMGWCHPLLAFSALVNLFLSGAFAPTTHQNTLHHHMTENDLKYFFGVDNHSEVPEYDITTTYQLGEMVPGSERRQQRAEGLRENKFYKVTAFGRELHLNLTLNKKLVSPDLVSETIYADGTISYSPPPPNNYYLGHVISDPHSMVAVSDNGGLTGMLKLASDTLFIHPLPTHLAKRAVSSEVKTPHLIYKRSLPGEFDPTDMKKEFKQRREITDGLEEEEKGNLTMKTMEVALMLEASSAATLEDEMHDPKAFLLLLGNTISGLFMDPSIGEIRIYYKVTRIAVIDKKMFGADYSESKGAWLSKFAKYIKSHQTGKEDVFSLVYGMKSGLGGKNYMIVIDSRLCLGLAPFKTMCKGDRPTENVNNMVGLQTALVITHETGHNMGVDHDVTDECPSSTYIMSAVLPGGPKAETWSNCSMRVIQEFLRSSKSKCLNIEAEAGERTVVYEEIGTNATREIRSRVARGIMVNIDLSNFYEDKFVLKLPGEVMNGDDQCVLQYGLGFRQCSQFALKARENVVNCGVLQTENGVTRVPLLLLTELPVEAEIGVSKECALTTVGPMLMAGGAIGRNLHHARERVAVEYSTGQDHAQIHRPCDLFCREGYTVTTYGKVLDSTRCSKDPTIFDVCIGGSCRAAGCDQVLGSNVRIDRCGVCGGKGDTCKHVVDQYKTQWNKTGKENADSIYDLPPGTTSASFVEVAATYNKIGLMTKNGDYLIDPDKDKNVHITYAGAHIHYLNKNKRFADELKIIGPTTPKLKIMCSTPCGAGIRRRTVDCILVDQDGRPSKVSDAQCTFLKKPQDTEDCNDKRPCLEVTTNKCDEEPCNYRGYCLSKKSDPAWYQCFCEDWFEGTNCEKQIYPCDLQPCKNGATCTNDPDDISLHHCQCPAWFTGQNCEVQLTSCDSNPCQNGGYCNSDPVTPDVYECECGDWFKGANCEVQIFPCDSKPCLNGATCRNDDTDISEYHCDCLSGFFGKKCQASPFIAIGCFKTPKTGLKEILANHKKDFNPEKIKKYIYECGELVFDKGYSHFALGEHGTCLSSGTAQKEYFQKGGTKASDCKDDIGSKSTIHVYTFETSPKSVPEGCFIEKGKTEKLLTDNYASFSSNSDPKTTVVYCSTLARDIGYEYFAVQNDVQCWTSKDIANTYSKYGKSDNCAGGVGKEMANFVYRIEASYSYPTGCDDDPCQNNGFCAVDKDDPMHYSCECKEMFSGKNCEVRSYACDSQPCKNGAACRNDEKDITKYNCDCTDDFSGVNCQVPSFAEIGCFKAPKSGLKNVLTSPKEFDSKKSKTYIYECAELAFDKGYSHFALGNQGRCLSSKTADKEYFEIGVTSTNNCKGGIGSKTAVDVYTFVQAPKFVPQGCFVEKEKTEKLLTDNYASFSSNSDPKATVAYCSTLARDMGYEYFAVQNEVQCWTSKDIANTFNKYGKSDNCVGGVGKEMANFVYRIEASYSYPTGCDGDPCQNNGFCVVNEDDPKQYSCECQQMFSGKNCEVQSLPCDSNPCMNGATCRNDDKDITKYHCDCAGDFSGVNCQVPSFIEIGCFFKPKSGLKEVLASHFKDFDPAKAKSRAYVKECGELAFQKGYKYFVLGDKGSCLSSAPVNNEYHLKGSTSPSHCKYGIGSKSTVNVHTFVPSPKSVPQGCFMEKEKSEKILTDNYASFSSTSDPKSTVAYCSTVARDKGVEYFAIRNQVECWTSNAIAKEYNKYGKSDHCAGGVGKEMANFVYRIEASYSYSTGCDDDPCQNNGFCVVNKKDPMQYSCECQQMFSGKNCEVQSYPCDSDPCVNGAACRNDEKDITKYHCDCTGDFSGINCQVPSFSNIGCFKIPKTGFKEVLAHPNKDYDPANFNSYILECAELAFDKGYTHFALGASGKCLSSATAKNSYYAKGAAVAKDCKNGIGVRSSIGVFTFESKPMPIAIGCFKENKGSKRLLKDKFATFVAQRNEDDPGITVLQCAYVARDKKIEYFALQNNGECWTDKTLGKAYKTYEVAEDSNCKDGIGGVLTNYVYQLK